MGSMGHYGSSLTTLVCAPAQLGEVTTHQVHQAGQLVWQDIGKECYVSTVAQSNTSNSIQCNANTFINFSLEAIVPSGLLPSLWHEWYEVEARAESKGSHHLQRQVSHEEWQVCLPTDFW